MLWPTPYQMITRLAAGNDSSSIVLPFVSSVGEPSDFLLKPADLAKPKDLQDLGGQLGDPPQPSVKKQNGWVITDQKEGQSWTIGNNKYVEHESVSYRVNERDPSQAGFTGKGAISIEIAKRKIDIFTTVNIESDLRYFYATVTRELTENGKLMAKKKWKEKIERDFQ
jgi:hypothetical protein